MNKATVQFLTHLIFLMFGAVTTFLIMRSWYIEEFNQMQIICIEEIERITATRDSLWENVYVPPRLDSAFHRGEETRDRQWRADILPPMLDSAFRHGMYVQDTVWQERLPAIRATADSIGFECGRIVTEAAWQEHLQDTVCTLQLAMEVYAQCRFDDGYTAGLAYEAPDEGIASASITSPDSHIFRQLLEDDSARWAFGILAFCLGFLITHLARRNGRTGGLRRWRRSK